MKTLSSTYMAIIIYGVVWTFILLMYLPSLGLGAGFIALISLPLLWFGVFYSIIYITLPSRWGLFNLWGILLICSAPITIVFALCAPIMILVYGLTLILIGFLSLIGRLIEKEKLKNLFAPILIIVSSGVYLYVPFVLFEFKLKEPNLLQSLSSSWVVDIFILTLVFVIFSSYVLHKRTIEKDAQSSISTESPKSKPKRLYDYDSNAFCPSCSYEFTSSLMFEKGDKTATISCPRCSHIIKKRITKDVLKKAKKL